jgi:uracil-DNA glycosylase family 4
MTPDKNCPLCPRLAAYRAEYRAKEPSWSNAPVPSFGALTASLLVVGQAPGVNGANRTGRPFTGDYAGVLLYNTLIKYGFAQGTYQERADDGLTLHNCRITNAVRCAPPQHKVETTDKANCNPFLAAEIAAMPNLRAILTLGGIAHATTLRALGLKPTAFKFAHGAMHAPKPGLLLANSYHVSRYNTSTKRLNTEMFEEVVEKIKNAGLCPAPAGA